MKFEDIYDAHFAHVWRSLRRLGVREADVADAAQEVFLVVHRKLGEFEGRSKMSTWLFGICLRVARDRSRLAYVRREVAGDDELQAQVDEQNDLVSGAERREGMKILEQILEQIDFEQRVVFTLFELEALSGDEIAELLQIPTPTVHSRLRLAREAFRRAVSRLHARGRFAAASLGAGGPA